jgi:cell filamentation protein, protein adenylyltransferase
MRGMATHVADRARTSNREFLRSHPWIEFKLNIERIDPWFWEMIGEARSKCRHLAYSPLTPAVAESLHALYLAKGVHATTAIEGNTLTEEQVLDAVKGDLDVPRSQEYLKREVDNVLGACSFIERYTASQKGTFTLHAELLRDLNHRVLEGLEVPDHVEPGEFRTTSVGVGLYRGAPPADVEFLSELLVDWLNGERFTATDDKRERFVRAFLRAVLAHVYIAWVHPFGDGNGRTARLVEFGILTAAGVPSVAAHLLSNHYNRTRQAYYQNLDRASRSGGDLRPFLVYAIEGFVDQLQEQLDQVHVQNLASTWENYIHHAFADQHGPTAKRQRDLVLALTAHQDPVPRANIRRLTPELAEAYAGKGTKTVTRDLNVLTKLGLIDRDARGIRARIELMYSFMPRAYGDLML